MSALAIVLILPIMGLIGALFFLIHKLYPGGIINAFTSGEDTQFAMTSSVGDENPTTVKLKETTPGTFQLVPGQSNSVNPLLPVQPTVTDEEAAEIADEILNNGSPAGSPAGSATTVQERRIPADQSKLQHVTPIP